MCSSGVGFNPAVGDKHLQFDLFGLYNGVFLMNDLQTGSIWSHLEGVALQGPLAGQRMEIIPLVHSTWEAWSEGHPDTLVLSEDTQWNDRYRSRRIGSPGLGPAFVQSIGHWDSRLPEATLVLGVEAGRAHAAYPLEVLSAHDFVVNDELDSQPIVAWFAPGSTSALAYSRVVGDEMLEFHASENGGFEDSTTGSTWDLQGLAIAGPLAGTQLRFVPSFITEWYGWAAHHPDTAIYDYELAESLIGVGTAEPRRRGR